MTNIMGNGNYYEILTILIKYM